MTPQTPWTTFSPVSITRGPLAKSERCDVLVVGSGISGALVAFHLAEAGADVVIIEQRALASGSTALSTALVQYELDVPMIDLVPQLGLADAQATYRTMRRALDDLRTLVDSNGLACQLTQRPTLYLARDESDLVHLKHEAIARECIGLDAAFVDAASLRSDFGISRPGAIRSPVSYELDPRALATQLLDAAVARGARIYDRTALASPGDADSTEFQTTDGQTIHAGHVVYATGYATPDWLPELRDLCTLQSTYALVTQPVEPRPLWPERSMLWEMGSPYFYARTTADYRIMIGGEDDDVLNPAARNALLPLKARLLLDQLEEATGLSGLEISSSWAATFAKTADGLPFIGSPPSLSHSSFNLGFGGNGIIFGLIGAQIIRDSLAGRHNAAARLFGFDRHSRSCGTTTHSDFSSKMPFSSRVGSIR